MEKLPFMTTSQAAEYLGLKSGTIIKLMKSGKLKAAGKIGINYVFAADDVETCRKRWVNRDGISHPQIAAMYGKSLRAVENAFMHRLRVRPDGRLSNGAVYDKRTVEKFAKILKWKKVEREEE